MNMKSGETYVLMNTIKYGAICYKRPTGSIELIKCPDTEMFDPKDVSQLEDIVV